MTLVNGKNTRLAVQLLKKYEHLAQTITCVETGQPCSESVGWICENHTALIQMRVLVDSLGRIIGLSPHTEEQNTP